VLEILGVDRAGEGVYLALVESAPMTAEEIENVTGVQQPGLGGALARLESRGLISRVPGSSARYTALPPETAIEVLLLSREREIQQVRRLAGELSARHRRGRQGSDAGSLIEVIVGPEGVARCGQQLFQRAEREVRGVDAPPYAQASEGEPVSSVVYTPAGVRRRSIYAAEALDLHSVLVSVASGEQVRVLPQPPMKMILVDDQAGLIPLQATPQVLDACILVHPSSLLDALSTLFESLWQQAQPFEAGADRSPDGLGERDQRILTLLALGLPDEAIARQLDIGYRTVQRRIQAMMGRLGATSRFQAGVLAASRGWLPEQRRPGTAS
jgi:DNA-binding CsgD family transcriptional regulator